MQLLDHPIQYLNIESDIIILSSFHDIGKFLKKLEQISYSKNFN